METNEKSALLQFPAEKLHPKSINAEEEEGTETQEQLLLNREKTFVEKYRIQNVIQTFGLFIVFLCFGIAVSLLGPTLKDLARTSHTPEENTGWLFTGKGIGGVVGSLVGGKLYDLFAARSMKTAFFFLAFNVFVMSSTMLLMPIMPSLILLLSVFVVFGMSVSLVNMGTNILLMWTWGSEVTPLILAMSCIAGIGNFIGPAIVSTSLDVVFVYWTGAAVVVTSAIVLLIIQVISSFISRREQKLQQQQQEIEKSDDYIQETTETLRLRFDNDWRLNAQILINKSRNLRVSIVVGLALFGSVVFESCYGGLGFSYLEITRLAKSKRENSLMSSTFWISLMVGRLCASLLSSLKIKPFLILSTNVVFCYLSVSIFLLISNIALPNIAILWLAIILMGMGVSSQFPTAMSFPTTSMSNIRVSGVMSSLMILMSSSAEMILPLMVTQVFGIHNLFWVLLAGCGLSTLAYSILFTWAASIQIYSLKV
jgi:MFS family permease